jgi:hypothetical protein
MTETETKWSERVREWRASGKRAEEFAEGRGFKASTLRFWASNLRRVTAGEKALASSKPQVQMVRVLTRPSRSDATIEVTVGAARVVIRSGFDRALLREVLGALGGES